jgi:hypothetical protein
MAAISLLPYITTISYDLLVLPSTHTVFLISTPFSPVLIRYVSSSLLCAIFSASSRFSVARFLHLIYFVPPHWCQSHTLGQQAYVVSDD